MNQSQLEELLLQALETEIGGVEIYDQALQCTVNRELHKEWLVYRKDTERHVEILEAVLAHLGIDPNAETPGREVVRHLVESFCDAMRRALETCDATITELVATECVSFAESKDHQNWELIGQVAKSAPPPLQSALLDALAKVELEEDRHLYHTLGWSRELWIQSLGLPAVLPPAEDDVEVTTEMGVRSDHPM